jgi:hypothetical protein
LRAGTAAVETRAVIAPAVVPSIAPAVQSDARAVEAVVPAIDIGAASDVPRDDMMGRELALVALTHSALRSGDADGALHRIDEFAAAFPHGALRIEVSSLRVRALCAAGRTDAARTEAERCLAEAPHSPYAQQVRDSCAFAGAADRPSAATAIAP